MPVSIRCRSCGANLQVKESFIGRRINCRDCGAPIDVTRGGGGGSAGGRRPAKRSSSGKGLLIGGLIGGGVLLLAGIGVGAVMIVNRLAGGPRPGPADGAFDQASNVISGSPLDSGSDGSATSRFDLPAQPAAGNSPLGAPASSGPANPRAGVGFGDVIGVLKQWRSARPDFGPEAEFEVLSQEPDSVRPQLWNVDVDAPAEPLVYAPERPNVRVQVPEGSNRATREDIVFPVVPSRFVAVGQNANKEDKREVWDITRPAKVGTITDLGVTTELNALSPDGKYFAGKTGFGTSVIGVWDVEARKPLVDIPLDELGPLNVVAMPRGDTLVVGSGFGDVNVAIYDLPSGQPRHQISTGWSQWDGHQLAWSPGGRYLALPYKGEDDWDATIGVIDLDNGEVAGQIRLPVYATWTAIGLNIEGLAFSYDGSELAAVLNSTHASKVVIWSVATGEITDHMTFPKQLKEIALGDRAFAQTATPLVWFPGGKRLLAFETLLLDRELATNVFELPGGELRENFPGLRRPLDDRTVTVLNVDGRDGYVVAYEIPEDELRQAVARVAETARQEPEVPVAFIEQAGWSNTSLAGVTWVMRQDAGWNVQPDPLSVGSDETRSVELAMTKGTIRQAGVSRTGSPQAVVLRSAGHDPFGRIPDGNVDPGQLRQFRWHSRPTDPAGRELASAGGNAEAIWLDVYDLAAGKRVREYRLGYDGDLVAVSPSAARCVILQNETANRVDVCDLVNGTNLAGWVPYHSEVDEQAQMVVSAAMPTENTVVTLSGVGKLVAWQLPDAAGGAVQALCAADNVSQPAYSPGGRYLSYSDGQAYYFVEIASGATAGRIPDVGEVQAAAFHPDGTRLALLSSHNAGYYLFTVDLTTGTVAAPFPVPLISAHMRWHGDRYLLLDHQKLVDVDQKCVAWTYALGGGDHLPMGYGDRHWYVGTVNDKPVLASAEVPDRNAATTLAGTTLAPEFVLQPGESCSVTYSLNHPALDGATRQRIETEIQGKLAANKITVAAGRPVTLQVTATETAGESVTREFDSIGVGGSETVTFTLKTATFRVAFVSGGQTVWEWSTSLSNDGWFVSHSENESIATALERDYQNGVKGGFSGVQLPPYVFAPKSANGLGTSQFTTALPR